MSQSEPRPGPMPTPPSAADRPVRRGFRILLIVSLALNLAVLGGIGGIVLAHWSRPPHHEARAMSFGVFTRALSPADRTALFRALGRHRAELRSQREAMRADFDALQRALRAVPFDGAELRAVMQRQRAAIDARVTLGQTLLLERIDRMKPAERAAFADRLAEAMTRMHRRMMRDAAQPARPPAGP